MDLRHLVDITATPQWEALTALPAPAHLGDLFSADPSRAERYVVAVGDLRIDYSKQRIDDAVVVALLAVAGAAGVAERRDAMFGGEPINVVGGPGGAARRPARRSRVAARPGRRPMAR